MEHFTRSRKVFEYLLSVLVTDCDYCVSPLPLLLPLLQLLIIAIIVFLAVLRNKDQ